MQHQTMPSSQNHVPYSIYVPLSVIATGFYNKVFALQGRKEEYVLVRCGVCDAWLVRDLEVHGDVGKNIAA